MLFTTGRGTPFGTFVPTMKIAINPVLAVASGEPARNEENDYREISIFKNGVTL